MSEEIRNQDDPELDDPFLRIRRKRMLMGIGLLLFLIVSLLICILIGDIGPIGPGEGGDYLNFNEAINVLLGHPSEFSNIIWNIRVPRVLLAGLVGAALATAGTAMQAVFRNSMADPFIIGVSSGAAVGAASASLFGLAAIFGIFSLPMLAFAGALVTVYVVYRLGTVRGRVLVDTLLLSGVAVAAFLGAVVSFMIYVAQQQYHQLAFWLLGSIEFASWPKILIIAAPIILGSIVVFLFARELNTLLLGEETAHNLGADPEFTKKLMLAVAALMTSAAVAFTGIIGFVGLMVPHMMRLIVGADHRILVPVSCLAGAIFLIWTDALSRSLINLPVGIITALFGGPFFVILLRHRKIRGEGR